MNACLPIPYNETRAVRPRRSTDDIFFIHCDRLALQSLDAIAISYIEEHDHANNEANANNHEHREQQDDSNSSNNQKQELVYPCSSPYCNETFQSMVESQIHYETNHCYQCSVCQCSAENDKYDDDKMVVHYPNEHLLDLHLKEVHDCYYQAALECKKVKLNCLVIGCDVGFHSVKDREWHLRNAHGYPNWFRFTPRKRKRKHVERRIEHNYKLNSVKQWWYNKRKNYSQVSAQGRENDDNGTNTIAMEMENDTTEQEMKVKQNRKERKKIRNATIPCRFYNSKGGCWRGEHCMFLHERSTMNNNNTPLKEDRTQLHTNRLHHTSDTNKNDSDSPLMDVNMDMDICDQIDALANQVRTKATINIPDNISFGRRRKRY